MSDSSFAHEMSDAIFEIALRQYPRRRRRHPDLRPYPQAREWARSLDWRDNPYDRFLLRRELLHYLESAVHIDLIRRAQRLANPGEIPQIVDHLLDTFSSKLEDFDVFSRIALRVPWEVAARHGRLRYNHLTKALRSIGAP